MQYYVLIPLLPLSAFVLNILFGKKITNIFGESFKIGAHWISLLGVASAFVLSIIAVKDVMDGHVVNADLYTWITSGNLRVSIGFLIDQLTAVMLVVVTSVSLLVHVYSIGYMHGDKGYYRFFSFLSLFTFSMLMLVMANNFLQLYFGWEMVGLCSYFLIGFWYEKKSAASAAKKAFVVNRFGDFGFSLGVMLVFLTFGTLHYADVFQGLPGIIGQKITVLGFRTDLVTVIALLLTCGAIGKSAQLPLHAWLPDAMEGPTPVSALIHAATMVTAGVFMIARTAPIFNASRTAMVCVMLIGGCTAFFAATIALVQNDIKRVIAYSTISQLGYMFMACGAGAYAFGIFHLYTHAFFKALLFLCAGSVMHAMQGELNIQKMGGLKKYMPVTYWTMLLASLSISGVPGLSGFFSKDEILLKTLASGLPFSGVVWVLGMLTAFLTAFYSFRVIFLTFHGKFRGHGELTHHLHESPPSMAFPLMVLAVGAVAAGFVGIPHSLGGHDAFARFLEPVVGEARSEGSVAQQWVVMGLSILASTAGIAGAAYVYLKKTDLPQMVAESFHHLHSLLYNKYYVDELYDLVVVRLFYRISRGPINRIVDGRIIEGVVNGVPSLIAWSAARLRRVQTGVVLHYSLVMAGGLFAMVVYVLARLWKVI
ncbi:MAG: NADH-quinone oxidoreductase subunit L [Nitrospirae bacterium]|nr:NADH-quinone oxidoreductase subunit L [Nitrospirota bacterium]